MRVGRKQSVDRTLPQGRDDCPRCVALEQLVRELEARLTELEDRLRANSSNSSTAPSSNPLWAPKIKPKKPTGKKPGGQKGHKGHHRKVLPIDEVDHVVEHRPDTCQHCQASLDQTPGTVRARHQVAELPPRAVIVTEHQALACTCPRCGLSTKGVIPQDIARSCTGPRLSAALCFLSSFVHGSRRAIEQVCREVLGMELSLGSISAREKEMTEALAGAYEQVQQRVRRAHVKNVDETGWQRAGRWLWVAATADSALFRIDRGRNWHGLQNLLGELVQGTICSDRHGLYERLKIKRRGICWAHLKRDFQRWIDRGGPTVWLGEQGLGISKEVFALDRQLREGRISRRMLLRRLTPLRQRLRELLQRGIDSGVKKAKYFCRNLLKVFDGLWTFARVPGLEPTNNHAERMLRPGVIWRKTCFGSHSDGGCRYVERMLSVVQTLRLRGRSVLDFLTTALHSHRQALPSPALI